MLKSSKNNHDTNLECSYCRIRTCPLEYEQVLQEFLSYRSAVLEPAPALSTELYFELLAPLRTTNNR